MKFKVSVILPIYNGEKTLAATLESLLQQTYQDFELIACIDGSNDGSLQIVNDFKDKFKKTTILINEKNLGLGPTMNRLTVNTEGDYIAVAEQDDIYYPNRLKKQVEVLDSNPDIGLVSGIADFWDGKQVGFRFPGILVNGKQYPKGEEMFLFNYRYQMKVVNTCMMFRKAVHVNNGLYFSMHYPNIPIDWAYVLRFCLISNIHGINESLVLLDRRNDRSSITKNKQVHFSAAKELLRSFKFEYPKIVTDKDYKFGVTTQQIMELSEYNKFKWPFYFVKFFIQNPTDKRWSGYVLKRLKL
ncbi:glycosyltransferase [Flavobacterium sp.]|uniref:glycosyltransferase family 2 protein n=1 Tax=Flavobacterium sp. TaxID=239 RepID=UPI002639D72A|nr:glycosyltransferase [Flavobacterium sp.]